MNGDVARAMIAVLIPVLLFMGAMCGVEPSAGAYPERLSSDFLKACTSKKRPAGYCECVLEVHEDEVSEKEFRTMDVAVLAGRPPKDAPDSSVCDSELVAVNANK